MGSLDIKSLAPNTKVVGIVLLAMLVVAVFLLETRFRDLNTQVQGLRLDIHQAMFGQTEPDRNEQDGGSWEEATADEGDGIDAEEVEADDEADRGPKVATGNGG